MHKDGELVHISESVLIIMPHSSGSTRGFLKMSMDKRSGLRTLVRSSVPTLWIVLTLALVLVSEIGGIYHHHLHGDPALAIPFCQERSPGQCCAGRDDDCIMPILDTICYCDQFCNR